MATLPGDPLSDATNFYAFDASQDVSTTSASYLDQPRVEAGSERTEPLSALEEAHLHAVGQIARADFRRELEASANMADVQDAGRRFAALRLAHVRGPATDAASHAREPGAQDPWARQLMADRVAELTRAEQTDQLGSWLDRLHETALQERSATTAPLIEAGQNLIDSASASGMFDARAAVEMKQEWVQRYATAWLESRPPEDRLRLLRGSEGADIDPATPGASSAASASTATPADFVPFSDRDRIRIRLTEERMSRFIAPSKGRC